MARSSTLIFGVGSLHRLAFRKQRQRLLRQALDIGFRDFDIAPSYGNGLNEVELGLALAGFRTDCQVTTKFGIPVDLYGARYPNAFLLVRGKRMLFDTRYADEYKRRVFSGDEMVRSVDGSLQRLRRDYVDDFLIHEPLRPLAVAEIEEIHEKAGRLKAQGKIRRWGVAGPVVSIAQFLTDPVIDVIQFPLDDLNEVQVASSKRKIAYGVYRSYLASLSGPNKNLTTYLRETLNQGGLDLIVATTVPARLASFAKVLS